MYSQCFVVEFKMHFFIVLEQHTLPGQYHSICLALALTAIGTYIYIINFLYCTFSSLKHAYNLCQRITIYFIF